MAGLLPRRSALCLLGAAVLARPALSQAPLSLVATSYGGQTERLINSIVYAPLQRRTRMQVQLVSMNGETAFARMRAEAVNPSIDLYHFSGGQEVDAKARGLTADIGDLGGVTLAPGFRDPDNQWAAFAAAPIGLLYNRKYVTQPPDSWLDLLKPEFRGHVGFPSLTNFVGPSFMLMLAHAMGRSMDDTGPAFEALGRLAREGAQIFERPVSLQLFFGGSDTWLVPYDVGNAFRLNQSGMDVGFAIPKEGTTASLFVLAIARQARNVEAARTALAAFCTEQSQIGMARQLRWSPGNTDVRLPAELQSEVLSGADLRARVSVLNQAAVRERMPDWIDRFQREVAMR